MARLSNVITIDGVVVGNATLGLPRQDIADVFGPQYLYSGWTWTGNIRSVNVGGHTVTAVAFDSGGAAAVLGAGQSITVTAAPPPGWTDYIFFGGLRIAKQTGSTHATTTYLHADHLGSIRRCTDANGNSNGECDYEPFGEYQPPSQSTCSALPTNFRFAGMFFDSENGGHGLYHTWFRQYDPAQGRWMSVDPLAGSLADPASLNRFAYVLADPVNLTDAFGLQAPRPPRETPNIPVEDSYEFINGQLWICNADGVTMPCALFWAFFGRHMYFWNDPEVKVEGVDWDPELLKYGDYKFLVTYNLRLAWQLLGLGDLMRSLLQRLANQDQRERPSELQERLQRLRNCAKAYYGLSTVATRVGVYATFGPIPKWLVGESQALGSGPWTTLLSRLSVGQGTVAGGNVVRGFARTGGPWVLGATAAIDVAGLAWCTFVD